MIPSSISHIGRASGSSTGGWLRPDNDVELRVDVVLQQAQSSVFPPVHHFVEEFDIVFYLSLIHI